MNTLPTPLVTVITPTWQRDPSIIRRAINCLQLQTINDWQMLLCSDGKKEDHIVSLLAQLNEPRVVYQWIPKSGLKDDYGNSVRRAMIQQASGKYITFFDDDNVITPDYFESMISAVQQGFDFAVCHIVHFGPLNVSKVGYPPKVLTGFPVKVFHVDSLQILVRAEAMKDIGWDVDYGYISDGTTIERLGAKYSAVAVPKVLGFHL